MSATRPLSSGVRLAELIMALSVASDLGVGIWDGHSLRVCLLAVHLGDALGLAEEELRDTYYLALLRLAGCTADVHLAAAALGDERYARRTMLSRLDWGNAPQMLGTIVRQHGAGRPLVERGRMLVTLFTHLTALLDTAEAHCEVAAQLAGRLGFGANVQGWLWQIFERWDGRGYPRRLAGEAIARPVYIAQLAHDAAIFDQLGGVEAAIAVARERSGGSYDPRVAEAFVRVAPRLFAALDAAPTWDAVLAAEPGGRAGLSETALDTAAEVIADFTDLKLPFTFGHSRGVAALASAAARHHGLHEREVATVRRAGLLHDVGRVGVATGVWLKPGPLTEHERERVRLHAYYTERILARPRVLAGLGAVAALHHERLDGSGYHRGLPGILLPPAARLLAAADVYQAMTEDRPHRPAHPPEAIVAELRRQARAGLLDGEAVDAVLTAAGHRVRRKRPERPAGLSDREREVLALLTRGRSNREMAAALGISKETVNHHVRHIYNKIGVSTRAAATLFAMQHGLVGDEAP
ncbi:MAG TPA: HD domain-containing phosphohydrolase [Thermomicrobiales bacterium]|nr:HD domain-containing phosphohydrolase [Thermomicrobiales bacterium]